MLWKCCTQYASNWKAQQWPQEWKRSVFIPIPEKANAKECSNYCTIALISHSSKVMLKFCKLGFNSMWPKNFQMCKLDSEKAEEPETTCQNQLDHRKGNRIPENIYFCFIDYAKGFGWITANWKTLQEMGIPDYSKAFDCVDHNKLWKILKEMGIPGHLTCLLRNLYAGQETTVRTGHEQHTGSK